MARSPAAQAWPWALYLLVVIGVLFLLRLSMSASSLVLLSNIAAGLGIPLLWARLKPYQQERILTFFDPTRDEMGTGYQATFSIEGGLKRPLGILRVR